MDGIVELAKLFKERDNVVYSGAQMGRIISPLPEIKISLGDKIILTKSHLVFASHLLNSDPLETGDRVILIPNKDEQIYYVIDKAVSL